MKNETLTKRQDAVNAGQRAGTALSELVEKVFRLDGVLRATGDALAQPTGQTTARWRVLAAVERASLSVAQIAREWSLARQSVQRVADQLERAGLVTYEPNPRHRRAKLVRLTPDGRAVLRRIRAAQRVWANNVGERIGAKDLEVAVGTLDRLLQIASAEPLATSARRRTDRRGPRRRTATRSVGR